MVGMWNILPCMVCICILWNCTLGCYISACWLCSNFQGEKKQQLLLLELEEVELLLQLQAKQKQKQQKQETKPLVPACCLALSFVAATEYVVCMLISLLAGGPDNMETQILPEMFATEAAMEKSGDGDCTLALLYVPAFCLLLLFSFPFGSFKA